MLNRNMKDIKKKKKAKTSRDKNFVWDEKYTE